MQYPSSIHSFTQITALLDHHALIVNRTFSHHTVSECFHKLQVETNSLNKARLLACSMPNANAWISALPSQQNKIFLFGMIYLYEKMARNAHLQPRPSLFSLAYAFQGFFGHHASLLLLGVLKRNSTHFPFIFWKTSRYISPILLVGKRFGS